VREVVGIAMCLVVWVAVWVTVGISLAKGVELIFKVFFI
jgi:hypothetical protein